MSTNPTDVANLFSFLLVPISRSGGYAALRHNLIICVSVAESDTVCRSSYSCRCRRGRQQISQARLLLLLVHGDVKPTVVLILMQMMRRFATTSLNNGLQFRMTIKFSGETRRFGVGFVASKWSTNPQRVWRLVGSGDKALSQG